MAKKKKVTAKKKPDVSGWSPTRRVLFRPDRFKYVRKVGPVEKGCVFCRAAQADLAFETLCVFKTKFSMVVVNKFPYNSGHILILPLKHEGHLLNLSDAEFEDLERLRRKALRVVEATYQPQAVNMGMNHGQNAGAGIPEHLHYHLIPRWAGDLNFFPLIAETKVVVEDLETSYRRLRQAFEDDAHE